MMSEAEDRLDPAYGSDDDPIMRALKAKTEAKQGKVARSAR